MRYILKIICFSFFLLFAGKTMAQSSDLFMKLWKVKDQFQLSNESAEKLETFRTEKTSLLSEIKEKEEKYFELLTKGKRDEALRTQLLHLYEEKHSKTNRIINLAISKQDEALLLELIEHIRPVHLKKILQKWEKDCQNRSIYQEWYNSFHLSAIGTELKHFRLFDQNGKEIDTKDLKGKILWIDSWASKCGPCIRKLKQMKSIYENYHERGFEVLAVSWDYTLRGYMKSMETAKSDWIKVMNKYQFKWLNVFDEKDKIMGTQFGILGKNMLVDENGMIIGFDLHPIEMEEMVKEKLSDIE